MKSKVFKKCILPQIESRFTDGWGNCTPDTLLLLICSNKHHKVSSTDQPHYNAIFLFGQPMLSGLSNHFII